MKVKHTIVSLLFLAESSFSFIFHNRPKYQTGKITSLSTKSCPVLVGGKTFTSSGFRNCAKHKESRSMTIMASLQDDQLIFGKFKIDKSQIFYESASRLTNGIVNLRPIVPGHVLVIPKRITPKLADLTDEEYDDLWRSARTIQKALEGYYNATGFNVAVQDGRSAGQSVPHVHIHILPRKEADFERNDDVYDELEAWAPTEAMVKEKMKNKVGLEVPDDADRRDRTMKMMEDECMIYRKLLEDK